LGAPRGFALFLFPSTFGSSPPLDRILPFLPSYPPPTVVPPWKVLTLSCLSFFPNTPSLFWAGHVALRVGRIGCHPSFWFFFSSLLSKDFSFFSPPLLLWHGPTSTPPPRVERLAIPTFELFPLLFPARKQFSGAYFTLPPLFSWTSRPTKVLQVFIADDCLFQENLWLIIGFFSPFSVPIGVPLHFFFVIEMSPRVYFLNPIFPPPPRRFLLNRWRNLDLLKTPIRLFSLGLFTNPLPTFFPFSPILFKFAADEIYFSAGL